MSASWPEDLDLLDAIGPWLYSRRWFPGQKGDQIRVLDTVDLSALSVADPANEPVEPVWISLIEVGENLLSVPLVYTDQAPSSGVVAHVRDAWIVDGAYSPLFLRAWIREAYTDGTISPLAPEQARTIRDRLLQVADQTHVISGEQSNTSVVFPGEAACVVKFLRVLHPGVHPELEVTQALAATGWECGHPRAVRAAATTRRGTRTVRVRNRRGPGARWPGWVRTVRSDGARRRRPRCARPLTGPGDRADARTVSRCVRRQ